MEVWLIFIDYDDNKFCNKQELLYSYELESWSIIDRTQNNDNW